MFRIFLAVMAMCDLGTALWDVRAFYTDQGILPRAVVEIAPTSYLFGAFFGSGQTWTQVFWILLAFLCAGFLLVGRQTRLTGFWLWYFLASLHIRNHFSADRGAQLLEIMLFWGFFLPLDARWSWSARQNPHWLRLPNRFRSVATVALLIQFSLIYLFTAALKNGLPWVVDFNAALVACRSNQVSTSYSEWLAQFPSFLYAMTLVTLAFEGLAPLLILTPIAAERSRQLIALILLCFHLHNCLVFQLGYFPLMNALFTLVLLPTSFWDRWLGKSQQSDQAEPLPANYKLSRGAQFWLVVCLGYCFYCNIQTCPKPRKTRLAEPLRTFGKLTRLEQSWELFSPTPPNDLWFRLLAKDGKGTEVDLWRAGGEVSLKRPHSFMSGIPSHRWQMTLLGSVYWDDPGLRRGIFDYWQDRYRGSYVLTSLEAVVIDYDQANHPLQPKLTRLWPPQPTVLLGR